jgi:transcriptional regulator with XRE-family HTH domain
LQSLRAAASRLKGTGARCILSQMLIGERLREIRESKNLSQGDIEQRTGLLRCYTSRVENGHTVPEIDTLEKYARAFEIPLYRLFYDGDEPPKKPSLPTMNDEHEWGANGKDRRELRLFANALSKMNDRSRKLLMDMAARMVARNGAASMRNSLPVLLLNLNC